MTGRKTENDKLDYETESYYDASGSLNDVESWTNYYDDAGNLDGSEFRHRGWYYHYHRL